MPKDDKFEDEEEFAEDEEPEFLEPEEHEESHAEHSMKLQVGDEEEDVYTEEGREELLEDDEIEPWEEGFSEGAEERGELGACAHCGKPLGDREENVFEKEYDDELMFFCSEKCAKSGPKKK